MAYSRQQSRIVDLVPVEIQDGQYGSVPNWIEKFVDVPRSGEWTCFRFAIAYDCRDY